MTSSVAYTRRRTPGRACSTGMSSQFTTAPNSFELRLLTVEPPSSGRRPASRPRELQVGADHQIARLVQAERAGGRNRGGPAAEGDTGGLRREADEFDACPQPQIPDRHAQIDGQVGGADEADVEPRQDLIQRAGVGGLDLPDQHGWLGGVPSQVAGQPVSAGAGDAIGEADRATSRRRVPNRVTQCIGLGARAQHRQLDPRRAVLQQPVDHGRVDGRHPYERSQPARVGVPDERDRVLLGQRRVLQVDHHEVESGLRAGLHDVDRRQLDEGPDQRRRAARAARSSRRSR